MTTPVALTQLVPGTKKQKNKKRGFRPKAAPKGAKTTKVAVVVPKQTPPLKQAIVEREHGSPRKETPAMQGLESRTKIISKEAKNASVETKPSSSSSPITKSIKSPSRKRKQSTSISVGIPNNAEKVPDAPASIKRRSSRISEAVSTPSIQNESSLPHRASLKSKSSSSPDSKGGAIVVAGSTNAAVPPQDQNILERLAAENPLGVRLTTFCSAFKGPKRPRRRKGEGAVTGQKDTSTKDRNTKNKNKNNKSEKNEKSKKNTTESEIPDASGAPVVQIIDGEIVLQESSLVVPGQRKTVQEVEEAFTEVVEEDAHLAIVGASYNSFVNRKGPQHWTVLETKRFYEALQQLGTDFCSMEVFFEDRNRKQLKRKYQSELIKNPELVDMALNPKNRKEVDMSVFNVEVDPKAIEAAAKDEPPPYIPTDEDGKPLNKNPDEENTPKQTNDASDQMEVVEEDAEEEKKTLAKATANGAQNSRLSGASLWPAFEDQNEQAPEEDAIDFPEPSMDDFFHEQDDIGDPTFNQIKEADPSVQPPPAAKVETAPSLSLVPKKSSSKSKRPKFRSVSRKKK